MCRKNARGGKRAALFALVVLLAGCQPKTTTTAPEPSAQRPPRSANGLTVTDPTADAVPVEILTEAGRIVVEIYPYAVPSHAENFLKLVQDGFYDGLIWHRVVDNPPVIQGGDPSGTGSGGVDYRLPGEQSLLRHTTGVLAMAQSAAGVSGSQFYITKGETPHLDPQFAVFGRVVEEN